MSNEPDKPDRSRWRAIALSWLGYAVVVLIVVALVGPSAGRFLAWIVYALLGIGVFLHSKLGHLPIEVEDRDDASAESPDVGRES